MVDAKYSLIAGEVPREHCYRAMRRSTGASPHPGPSRSRPASKRFAVLGARINPAVAAGQASPVHHGGIGVLYRISQMQGYQRSLKPAALMTFPEDLSIASALECW